MLPGVTDEIKLSICIATYNRGAFIVDTLSSIVGQIRPDVELIVVDGASTDDTSERVRDFRSRHTFVRYFREAKNSGVDQDFDKAVSYATGEYVWLMTDDDLMIDGAVSRVRAALEGQYDLVIVNSEVRNPDLGKVLNPRLLDVSDDLEYARDDRTRLFVDTARALTFIGSVVIKRSVWLARRRDAYYGSLFIHVGVIFQAPIGCVRVIADPMLRIRYGVAMWTPRSFDVWMYKWPDADLVVRRLRRIDKGADHAERAVAQPDETVSFPVEERVLDRRVPQDFFDAVHRLPDVCAAHQRLPGDARQPVVHRVPRWAERDQSHAALRPGQRAALAGAAARDAAMVPPVTGR